MGTSYDPKNDLVIVSLDDKLEHNIPKPQDTIVDEDDTGIHSIEITCSEGHKHILKFKNPLPLPPAK